MMGTTRARPTAGSGTSPASSGWRRGWGEDDARVLPLPPLTARRRAPAIGIVLQPGFTGACSTLPVVAAGALLVASSPARPVEHGPGIGPARPEQAPEQAPEQPA